MEYCYLFHLGREIDLSKAELLAILGRYGNRPMREKGGAVNVQLFFSKPIDAKAIMASLGGTVKISERVPLAKGDMIGSIAGYLDGAALDGKIVFSLSGGAKTLPIQVKKELKRMNRSVRYVEPKNTATIEHNNLVERGSDLTIIDSDLFATVAIQPFADFSKRDYGRPGRDSHSGMLPPKLARMMVNLAEIHPDTTLLDPFCGSGTIVTEALLLGYRNVMGSDISDRAVADTKINCQWTKTEYGITAGARISQANVVSLGSILKPASVGAIVTEPFLGKPRTGKETKKQLEKQLSELENLYKEAFAAFAGILMPGGVVLWAMPAFHIGKEWLEINPRKIIGEHFSIETFLSGEECLLYAREDQHVGRRLWKFKKT